MPTAGGAQKFVFTIQLAQSAGATSAPANSQWYIIWNRLHADANFDRWWVAMKTDAAGLVHYEYGKFGVPTDPLSPNTNTNIAVKIGDADSGTYNPATGVITITLATSKAEGAQPGQPFNGFNVRTFTGQPDTLIKSTRTAADITGDGTYVLVGNNTCH